MPSFWPEGIDNTFLLSKNHCKCLSFGPEGIANAFLFTLNGKFSLTIGMIMPLGWGEVTGIIPKLVTLGHIDSSLVTRDLWGIQMGFRDSFENYFFLSSPCLSLSLKASRHASLLRLSKYCKLCKKIEILVQTTLLRGKFWRNFKITPEPALLSLTILYIKQIFSYLHHSGNNNSRLRDWYLK